MSERDRVALNEAVALSRRSKASFMFRFAKNWLLERLAATFPVPSWRVALHRWRGIKIGKNVYIGYEVIFDRIHPELITIGDYVEIGDRSIISAHSRGSMLLRDVYPRKNDSVRIETGAWIAPGCIILQGVTIGEKAVVGTGSVVTRDVPARCVVVGVPAKVIRRLDIEAEAPGGATQETGERLSLGE